MGLTANGDAARLRASTVIVLLALLAPALARAGEPLRITRSDARGLHLECRDLTPTWAEQGAGAATRHDLRMPGLTTSGPFGGWRVPATSRWIVVPPGTRPRLVVVEEDWQPVLGRRLAFESVPASRRVRQPGDPGLVELRLAPGEQPPADLVLAPEVGEARRRGLRARSGAAVELGEPRPWRGRRVAPLTLVPVRHGGDGTVTGVLGSGRWEIRFEPDASQDPGGATRLDTRGDERFSGAFLNPDLLRSQPSEAAFHGVQPPRTADKSARIHDVVLEAPEVRIGVAKDDLYRVSAARLLSQGLLTAAVDESQIRLYQRRYLARLDDGSGDPPYVEIEVPIHLVGEGDAFADDDYFVFYGLRPRSDTEFTADVGEGPETIPGCGDNFEWNNGENIYWLAAATPPGGVQWARMEVTTLDPASGPAQRSYRRVDYQQEQAIFREQISTRTTDRLYFNHHQDGNVLVGLDARWSPDPLGAPAELEVSAAAYSDSNDFFPALVRLVDVALNVQDGSNTALGTMRVGTTTPRAFTFTDIPVAALQGTSASVRFTPRLSAMWSYINWVRLTYDALYRATTGLRGIDTYTYLDFHTGGQAGPRDLQVTGYDDPEIGLFEVTDPRAPRFVQLAAGNVLDAGGTWTLSIRPDQPADDEPRRYVSASKWQSTGIAEFAYYESSVADDPTDPLAVSAPPEVLVVTHSVFREALQPWLDHRLARSGGDLDIHVVDVQDLYDWYSGGLRDPWAVRRFVRHAVEHSGWPAWALVIVGDANENARELAVRPEARAWSRDWVPTHYHVQSDAVTGIHELMATDKWYVTGETGETHATDDFPSQLRQPWDMLTGRLPCNSVEELERMIDKIIAVETYAADQDWRRRSVIIADDDWSDGYGAEAIGSLQNQSYDRPFEISQTTVMTPTWNTGSPVELEAELVRISEWLDPLYPDPPYTDTRPVRDVRDDTEAVATPRLIAALSRSGTFAHYQGHANLRVLSSEYWMVDFGTWDRRDIDRVSNTGRPFVFFGMGCHISDWAQSPVQDALSIHERSFCEKFLVNSRNGAAAAYGSSGYEFIRPNVDMSEQYFEHWLTRPPVSGPGGTGRSRWMLGEMLWASEAEWLAANWRDTWKRAAVCQYVLLGDPLMMLDAGPPQVSASLPGDPGQELDDGADITGQDATNLRRIAVVARDEAGIDRLRVTDSEGTDLTSTAVVVTDSLPPGETDHQEVHYELAVPVRPFAHTIDIEVWDTSAPLPGDRHATFTLNVGQDVVFTVGGEVVDPERYRFTLGLPTRFSAQVASAAWLHDGMTVDVQGSNLIVTEVTTDLEKTNAMSVSFTATAPLDTEGERAVGLVIDDHRTSWVLQAEEQTAVAASIGAVYSFPNPLREDTRIVFEAEAAPCRGVVRIFSAAGRTITRLPVDYDGSGAGVVAWDGRDAEGDVVANGTYLYRVELAAPDGGVASAVQRLVVMR